MPIRVHIIRTHYPHWSRHSGINQFIGRIDPARFAVTEDVVPTGQERLMHLPGFVRRRLRGLCGQRGMPVYSLNDLHAECRVIRQIRNGDIDVLHYLDGEHSMQFIPTLRHHIGARCRAVSVVATFHQPPDALASLINTDIVRRADRVTVLAPSQQAYFAAVMPEDRIVQILHGVDTEHFRPGAADVPDNGQFRCLTVGYCWRDYDAVFAVAERLRDQTNFVFDIVNRDVKVPDRLPNVRHHKNLDDDGLLTLYQTSQALLLPLKQATANNVILEAMACGLPIISTDLTALRAYAPGEEATLVSDNDIAQLADAVIALYAEPDHRQRMAAAARTRAEQLSWDTITGKFENLYSDLNQERT